MTLQETIERKLYETWCEVHGAEPNWGRSTPQSPGGFKTSRSLWAALAYAAIACVRERATSEEAEAKGDERTKAMLHSEILDYQSGRVAWIKGVPRDGRKSIYWLRGWDAAHDDYNAEDEEAKRKEEQKWNIRAAMAAQIWRPISEDPPVGSKIIALFADGSGSTMFFRHDGGFIDQDGYDWEVGDISDQYAFWAFLPSAFEFWCEQRADDPMRLSASVAP